VVSALVVFLVGSAGQLANGLELLSPASLVPRQHYRLENQSFAACHSMRGDVAGVDAGDYEVH